jgi:hypothetical protein
MQIFGLFSDLNHHVIVPPGAAHLLLLTESSPHFIILIITNFNGFGMSGYGGTIKMISLRCNFVFSLFLPS